MEITKALAALGYEETLFLERAKNKELTEENERLRDFVKKQFKAAWTVREDTVRKMQKRLKMYFGTYILGYKIPLSEALEVIDQIAKEMLEEAIL